MAINRLPIKLNQWVKRNGPIEKFIFINLKKEMNKKIAVNVNRKITNQISGIHCFFNDKNSPYSEIIYWLILIKNYFDFFKNTQILRNSNNVVRSPLSLVKSPFFSKSRYSPMILLFWWEKMSKFILILLILNSL